ncbi:Two-pore potassium channel 2 [Zea mays]|uniref:Two-pore potassium channel 2 n=2 Tax=Zea mays TaxID=4577 RepID=A0A3L6FKR7_MAIZE|nr:Two-pore potassium channel 2 [Zea mays]
MPVKTKAMQHPLPQIHLSMASVRLSILKLDWNMEVQQHHLLLDLVMTGITHLIDPLQEKNTVTLSGDDKGKETGTTTEASYSKEEKSENNSVSTEAENSRGDSSSGVNGSSETSTNGGEQVDPKTETSTSTSNEHNESQGADGSSGSNNCNGPEQTDRLSAMLIAYAMISRQVVSERVIIAVRLMMQAHNTGKSGRGKVLGKNEERHRTPAFLQQSTGTGTDRHAESLTLNHHGYKAMIQPENYKLQLSDPSSNMPSMDEPLLPLVQRDQKYISKKDRRSSCDVPSRCATSFSPSSYLKANFSTLNHLPPTDETTSTVPSPNMQRVHSSPSIFTSSKEAHCVDELGGQSHAAAAAQYTPSIARRAIVSVILYISIGVLVYMTNVEGFKGKSTFKLVDALYFTIISLCTIGYGDIVPCTTFTKVFTCLFLLVGVRFIDLMLNGLLTNVLDKQRTVLLSTMDDNKLNKVFDTYMIDARKKRSRGRMKVILALSVVAGTISICTIIVHEVEGLNWIDSFYLSVISVTTVGYGDKSFSTTAGRLTATVCLLVSTLAVAKAFLFLTDLRMDKRNRRTTKWILKKKMDNEPLVGDLENHPAVSKSDFVIYKLKEMGKIDEKDIKMISDQFDQIEFGKCERIPLADIIGKL